MFWVLKDTLLIAEVQMRHVKHGLLLVGVLSALAFASFGGSFQPGPPVTGDGTTSADDNSSADGIAFARIAGLHW